MKNILSLPLLFAALFFRRFHKQYGLVFGRGENGADNAPDERR